MKTIKGPALFLAQFAGDAAPFDSLPNIARWAADLGYRGIQVPVDPRFIDLDRAAESKDYCDEIAGTCREAGVEITELSTHMQGQLVAVHPAYAAQFDAFVAGVEKAFDGWLRDPYRVHPVTPWPVWASGEVRMRAPIGADGNGLPPTDRP